MYLAQRCDSRLDIIQVVLDSAYGGDSAATFQLIEDLKERGKKLLEQYKSDTKRKKIQAETLLELGDHAQVIIDTANKNDYDLMILASRGRGPFKELLLGRVSFKVLHRAKCPVMVVR